MSDATRYPPPEQLTALAHAASQLAEVLRETMPLSGQGALPPYRRPLGLEWYAAFELAVEVDRIRNPHRRPFAELTADPWVSRGWPTLIAAAHLTTLQSFDSVLRHYGWECVCDDRAILQCSSGVRFHSADGRELDDAEAVGPGIQVVRIGNGTPWPPPLDPRILDGLELLARRLARTPAQQPSPSPTPPAPQGQAATLETGRTQRIGVLEGSPPSEAGQDCPADVSPREANPEPNGDSRRPPQGAPEVLPGEVASASDLVCPTARLQGDHITAEDIFRAIRRALWWVRRWSQTEGVGEVEYAPGSDWFQMRGAVVEVDRLCREAAARGDLPGWDDITKARLLNNLRVVLPERQIAPPTPDYLHNALMDLWRRIEIDPPLSAHLRPGLSVDTPGPDDRDRLPEATQGPGRSADLAQALRRLHRAIAGRNPSAKIDADHEVREALRAFDPDAVPLQVACAVDELRAAIIDGPGLVFALSTDANRRAWLLTLEEVLAQLDPPLVADPPVPERTQQTPGPPAVRLHLDDGEVFLDGQHVFLDMNAEQKENALAFIGCLIANRGNWMCSREIGRVTKNEGMRWDRVYKALPEAIRAVTQSKTGAGYRLMA
jgi:hypothetical protein